MLKIKTKRTRSGEGRPTGTQPGTSEDGPPTPGPRGAPCRAHRGHMHTLEVDQMAARRCLLGLSQVHGDAGKRWPGEGTHGKGAGALIPTPQLHSFPTNSWVWTGDTVSGLGWKSARSQPTPWALSSSLWNSPPRTPQIATPSVHVVVPTALRHCCHLPRGRRSSVD